jgi:outer membrane murein-binding lipoprotein Lpp
MKNQSILVAVVALASVTVLAGCNQPSKATPTQPAAQGVQQAVASLFNPVYASDSYVEYTPAALAKAKADGKETAVFFHGATCGSCAKLDADFKENEVIIPEDLVVFKADWDSNQKLAGELNVASYHTIAYYNEDGSTDNVKGLFTVEEVVQAGIEETIVLSAN